MYRMMCAQPVACLKRATFSLVYPAFVAIIPTRDRERRAAFDFDHQIAARVGQVVTSIFVADSDGNFASPFAISSAPECVGFA